MLKAMVRDWLMDTPKKTPCPCGQHPDGHPAGDRPHFGHTNDQDGPVSPTEGVPVHPQSFSKQPDLTKAHSLRVVEKRTAITQEYVLLVYDGPGTYLLGAFIGADYTPVRDEAVAFIEQFQKDVAAKRKVLLDASHG